MERDGHFALTRHEPRRARNGIADGRAALEKCFEGLDDAVLERASGPKANRALRIHARILVVAYAYSCMCLIGVTSFVEVVSRPRAPCTSSDAPIAPVKMFQPVMSRTTMEVGRHNSPTVNSHGLRLSIENVVIASIWDDIKNFFAPSKAGESGRNVGNHRTTQKG